jgi:hypothetical protein
MDALHPRTAFQPSYLSDRLLRAERGPTARQPDSGVGSVVGGALVFAIGGALLAYLLGASMSYHWDAGFVRAKYRLRVVDDAGRPLPGVAFDVEGPIRPTRGRWNVADGNWPIYELERGALRSNRFGRLVVHQPERGLQFGGRTSFWSTEPEWPVFTCVFRKPGYRPVRLSFRHLDATARLSASRNELEPGPGGFGYPTVDVEVVLRRE